MFWFWGCDGTEESKRSTEVVEWYAYCESSKVASEQPIVLYVDVFSLNDWSVSVEEPHSKTMRVQRDEKIFREKIGDRVYERHRFLLYGTDGSHVIESLQLQASNGTEQKTYSGEQIFVDIGIEGPSSEVNGLLQVEDTGSPIWPWIIGAGILSGIVGWYGYRRQKNRSQPLSPVQRAREQWQEIRASGASDHDLAVALSMIVRVFLDSVLESELVHKTPLEAKNWVSKASLPQEIKQALSRIFNATDLLKYAREGGGESFFNRLEQDLILVLHALDTTEER
ncbi:MAG: hypothetical protein VX278_19420 [Myxococcota bacterium]|nr:hypothetical protein [Myxococcota bacterium]